MKKISKDWVEEIRRSIPFFRGYEDKRNRRDSDDFLRNYFLDVLLRYFVVVTRFQRTVAHSDNADHTRVLLPIAARTDLIIHGLRRPLYSDSLFFHLKSIVEPNLDLIYFHDRKLIELSDELTEVTRSITSAISVEKRIANITESSGILNKIDRLINDRTKLVLQTKRV